MSKKEQNADKKVRIIEADPGLSKKNDTNRILKVAAYCRVSQMVQSTKFLEQANVLYAGFPASNLKNSIT